MAGKIYSVVGRYMDGANVVGYHLVDGETNQGKQYTNEQVAFLVGAKRVENMTGQLYGRDVVFRGKGFELKELPVVRADGSLGGAGAARVGHIRRGTTATQAIEQLVVTGAVVEGRSTRGYVVSNGAGQSRYLDRMRVIKMAMDGRIGNARVQNYGGQPILRGVGINLNGLPTMTVEQARERFGG